MIAPDDFIEWAFKGIVGGAFIIGAYVWRNLVDSLNKTRESLYEHKIKILEQYVTKAEHKADCDRLEANYVRDAGDVKAALIRINHRMDELLNGLKK